MKHARLRTLDTTLIISLPIYFLIARTPRFIHSSTYTPSLCTSSVWYGVSIWKDPFFSVHIERALNHDEMLRDALNYSILKYWQIFTKSDTISNRFCNDVTKMSFFLSLSLFLSRPRPQKKTVTKSALSRALEHAQSLVSNNTLVSNFQLTLVLSSSKNQAFQVNFTKSIHKSVSAS